MASVESGAAESAAIWGNEERGCRGKITRRRVVAVGALATCAVVGLGLFVGLNDSSSADSDGSGETIVGQAVDSNSLGCYADNKSARTMHDRLQDFGGMTPSVCNSYCSDLGYTIYALQWGVECWCGGDDTDYARHGASDECTYTCSGDNEFNCGGYTANLVYKVGTDAGGESSVPDAITCEGTATTRIATSSGISYFETGGCATLTSMYNAHPGETGPLKITDVDGNLDDSGVPTGYWLLTMDLRVHDGSTLMVHGTSIGGDCDILRIQSDGSKAFHELRAHGGNLSFRSTKVISWDTEEMEEQTTYEDGRSFINCVSEVYATSTGASSDDTCDGAAKNDMGECRMDIIDSVMGNLGWFDAESYGLTWKVRGFCQDLSNPEVFDRTGVYGDIQNSEIYGMYYGMYSYGHDGGVWKNNIMRDNILYGFDPHDDSDDLEISNNKVYGNGNHGIIASKRCNNVKIFDNEVYEGGESAAGIFLHRSSDSAQVYNNYVHDMQDAGFAILESMGAEIYDNIVENVKYGIRISLGGADNNIHDNSFDGCTSSGLYTYEGSDEPDVSDGRPSGNVYTNNVISNTKTGVKLQDGDDNVFTGNDFTGTSVLEFDDSKGIVWTGNTVGDACYEGSVEFASGSDSLASC